MLPPEHTRTALAERYWLPVLLLGLFVYFSGIGGQYVPSNGDEMVYAHIARKTGESGQWLPLQSDLPGTRNTKPPLLFWQAMASGAGSADWSLAAMRAPSLAYLVLICLGMLAGLRACTGRWLEGLQAACLLLAFQSTFRFVRPYLTSAPETFWFSLPLFILLWQSGRRPRGESGWLAHIALGLTLGLGLAYKSYALVLPTTGAWFLALIAADEHPGWQRMLLHASRVAFSGLLALGVFFLWLALDPDPHGVVQEFIIGENAGKFADAHGWLHEALTLNGSSIWSQLLAYPVNGGLLFTVVLGLMISALIAAVRGRRLGSAPVAVRILLAWAVVWALTFLIPSQRSARYVIPAMPAIAMLLALHWSAIRRGWFFPVFALCAAVLLVLARVGWVSHDLGLASATELGLQWGVAILALLAMGAGLWRPQWLRGAAVLATMLVYQAFNLTVAPFDGPLGHFPTNLQATLPSGPVAVPNGFNGQFERFQFLIPGGQVFVPYETGGRALSHRVAGVEPPDPQAELEDLLDTHAAVVWTQDRADRVSPPCLPGCRVLGQRWLMTSRHLPGEVRWDNLWEPGLWLFRREWILTRRP